MLHPFSVFLCIWGLLYCCNGQNLTVKIDPDSFLPTVTSRVTVTCTLTSPPSGSRVLVMQLGKQSLQPKGLNESIDEKKDTEDEKAEDEDAEDTEALLVTQTNDAPALIDSAIYDERMEAEGGISDALSTVSFTLTALRPDDAARYLCHASLLSSQFHVTEMTKSANLSLIDDEKAPSLLLAKEQILEEEVHQLEQQEIALQEHFNNVSSAQHNLDYRVIVLENKTDEHSLLLDELISQVDELKLKNVNDIDHVKVAVDDDKAKIPEVSVRDQNPFDDLQDLRSSVEQLLDVLVPSLVSRLTTLENSTVPNITGTLSALQHKLSALEMEKELKQNDHDHDDNDFNNKEKKELHDLIKRVNILETETTEKLGSQVVHLEKIVVPELEGRLNDLENSTLKVLVQQINSLAEQQSRQSELIEQMKMKHEQLEARLKFFEEGKIDNGEKAAPESDKGEETDTRKDEDSNGDIGKNNDFDEEKDHVPEEQHSKEVVPPEIKPEVVGNKEEAVEVGKQQCYVCGDYAQSKPCTVDDLRSATTLHCPVGSEFCMNDIIQEQNGRQIYKRCVSDDECLTLHNADSDDNCAAFSFMSHGHFICHFCCHGDNCNFNFKPSDDTLVTTLKK